MKEFWLIFFLTSLFRGILGQVTTPPSTTVAIGDDVSLTCTSTEDSPTFVWSFTSDDVPSQTLFSGSTDLAGPIRYSNIVLRDSADVQTSILGINAIELEDEGRYTCTTADTSTTPPATVVTVEVGSTSKPISLDSSPDYSKYIATCEAIGSKPGENITWTLDGDIQTDVVVPTGPTERGDSLFDTTSMFTFPATFDNYNATLKCIIGGHQVDKLNRQETRLVDVHNPPETEGITIVVNNIGTNLKVTCEINDAVDEAIPPMESFYIYSNGTLVPKQVSANSVTVSEPDYDTEYMCVGGNYLGNTTATEIFYPGRTTTPPTTTAPNTTEPVVVGPTGTPGTEPVLSTGAIAGIAVGSIIAIAVIIVLIVVFVVKPDCIGGSGSPNTTTTHKHSTSAVGSSNGNEKEKIRPEAAPRGHSSIKHTTDNPQQAEYAMVDRRPGGRGDSTDARGNGAGQNEQPGMHYADLDLTSSAGHSDRVVPKNEDGVVVYSSILV